MTSKVTQGQIDMILVQTHSLTKHRTPFACPPIICHSRTEDDLGLKAVGFVRRCCETCTLLNDHVPCQQSTLIPDVPNSNPSPLVADQYIVHCYGRQINT